MHSGLGDGGFGGRCGLGRGQALLVKGEIKLGREVGHVLGHGSVVRQKGPKLVGDREKPVLGHGRQNFGTTPIPFFLK